MFTTQGAAIHTGPCDDNLHLPQRIQGTDNFCSVSNIPSILLLYSLGVQATALPANHVMARTRPDTATDQSG